MSRETRSRPTSPPWVLTRARLRATSCFRGEARPIGSGAESLLYSTYFGGSNYDEGYDIAVDSLATPMSREHSFEGLPHPARLTRAFPSLGGRCQTAFVAKLNPSASGVASLVYSTYLGGR